MSISEKAVFNLQNETKGTYRYEEQSVGGQPLKIGLIYIRKWVFGKNRAPSQIQITIEEISEL